MISIPRRQFPKSTACTYAAPASLTPFLLATAGCGSPRYPPTFNILGSYFPSWLVCFGAASALAFMTHVLFTRVKLVHELWPLPVVYIALVTFLTCALWLIFFQ